MTILPYHPPPPHPPHFRLIFSPAYIAAAAHSILHNVYTLGFKSYLDMLLELGLEAGLGGAEEDVRRLRPVNHASLARLTENKYVLVNQKNANPNLLVVIISPRLGKV